MSVSTSVSASGFALIEQSASSQGLSYAGAAASTEDASVMWFNVAGMAKILGSQVIVGGHIISPTAKFTNEGTTGVTGPGQAGLLSGSGDDGAKVGYVPNLYWKTQVGRDHFGVGFNVPFGQHISYDSDWVGRYVATETDLKTYNINTNWAHSVNDQLQLGLGFNAQYVDVILEQKINQAALGDTDANAKVTGSNWTFGYNLGLMYQPVETVNIGLSYRSEMNHNVDGQVRYNNVNSTVPVTSLGPMNQVLFDAGASADVTLPASASLAVDYQVHPSVQLLASTTWTGWSAYDQLVVKFDNYSPDSESHQDFKDSWRYAVGAIWQATDRFKLRTGLAYDQSPVPNKESRSPRTPDSDRKWVSVGLGYAVTQNAQIDLAYSHLFADRSQVDYTSKSSLGDTQLKGYYDSSVNIVSAQFVWRY
ncbi:MAG: OmpP1/FadL family transporter [Hydrogenovibrio sp.]